MRHLKTMPLYATASSKQNMPSTEASKCIELSTKMQWSWQQVSQPRTGTVN